MARKYKHLGARLRLVLGPDIAIGPGKVDLLEQVRETGSIAEAGRTLGMSYKRAWQLISTMNDAFKAPVVVTSRGGASKGGATLTEFGADLLKRYRRIQTETERAVHADLEHLTAELANGSDET
ncbi:MAG: LysR family transcriptional regulator [Rhizobiales bacterium]|nr:LysR family transcriptional regulator [Hyphomicrobiales bacterium]